MRQAADILSVQTRGRGLHEITVEIRRWTERQARETGLLTIFCRHTSASLLIQENAAREVRSDLEAYFEVIAPEAPGRYAHDDEGPDDMPAHIRTALTGVQLSIPVIGGAPALDTADFNEARAQMIVPLALGGDTGRHMAATDAVRPLTQTPERPQIELTATLGSGDSFARLLERSGVGGGEAQALANQVASAVPLADIAPGTRIDLILGRRAARTMPRPVDALAMRARFDLRIEMEREGDRLVMRRIPIAVDTTPLRIRGRVGDSLYRSARAAGAPPAAIQSYLRVIGRQISVGSDIRANDEYDIIVDYRRAETGESETGKLLYAGLIRGGKPKLSMLEWTVDGRTQWFEASGVGERRGGMVRPTNGRVTSTFGMRRHPILGYKRMHSGMDFGGGYGAPIYAVTDGVVTIAGRPSSFAWRTARPTTA